MSVGHYYLTGLHHNANSAKNDATSKTCTLHRGSLTVRTDKSVCLCLCWTVPVLSSRYWEAWHRVLGAVIFLNDSDAGNRVCALEVDQMGRGPNPRSLPKEKGQVIMVAKCQDMLLLQVSNEMFQGCTNLKNLGWFHLKQIYFKAASRDRTSDRASVNSLSHNRLSELFGISGCHLIFWY